MDCSENATVEPEVGFDRLLDYTLDNIVGVKYSKQVDEEIQMAREGNPFPLARSIWPILEAPREHAKYFEGTVGDDENPCLMLESWQREYLSALFDDSVVEVAIKGCVGAGKGGVTSMAINLAYVVWDECRIGITSASYNHARDTLFAEVLKWRKLSKIPMPGTVTKASIENGPHHNIWVFNPLTGEGFSGKHGGKIMLVADEATGVSQMFYDNATNQFHKLLAISNPRSHFGWFRDLYRIASDQNKTQYVDGPFGRRLLITVGGYDCTNVRLKRLEKPVAPIGGITIHGREYKHGDRIKPDHFRAVAPIIPGQLEYGRFKGLESHPDKNEVEIKAFGRFPRSDASTDVIMAEWLDRHIEAHKYQQAHRFPSVDVCVFGLDVARSLDGDATVLTAGGPGGVYGQFSWGFDDNMAHVTEIFRVATSLGVDLTRHRNPICIDCDGGYGAGVADVLKSRGVWVIEFHGNQPSEVDRFRYGNLRAEAYACLARRLDPNDRFASEAFPIPNDSILLEELCAPKKVFLPNDATKFRITPKNAPPGVSKAEEKVLSLKSILGRSPDKGDSLAYFYHGLRIYQGINSLFRSYSDASIAYPSRVNVDDESVETDLLMHLRGRYNKPVDPFFDDEDDR